MDVIVGVWLNAVRFRRLVSRVLRRYGLTFSQWRVLHAAERLIREVDEPVSQLAIARRVDGDEGTVSRVALKLMHEGFLDIGPDGWGWSYRVLVTIKGQQALESIRPEVDRIAAMTLEKRAGLAQQQAGSRVGERGGSEVDDGGAAEGFDGDFGQELGVRDDADVGKFGLEELADVAADVGLGEHDDR